MIRSPALAEAIRWLTGTDPADPRRDPRHLPERPPLAEPLEPAKLRDVEPRVGDLPVVAELDRDLGVPLDPRHRVDDDALCP